MYIGITVTQYIDTYNRVKTRGNKHKYYGIILYRCIYEITVQYKNKNNKAEIGLNNKITAMLCSIPTLNTALVFTLMIHGDVTPSNLERRAPLLGI